MANFRKKEKKKKKKKKEKIQKSRRQQIKIIAMLINVLMNFPNMSIWFEDIEGDCQRYCGSE